MRHSVAAGVFLLGASALYPQALRAQNTRLESGRVVGQVLDAETGRPIDGVVVRIAGMDRPPQLTRSDGRFLFPDVPQGIQQVEFEHIAYGRVQREVNVPRGDIVTVTARLRHAAIALDSVTVTVQRRRSFLEQAGFLRRQQTGWGHFFIDDDVTAWRLDQSLRAVPGLSIRYTGTAAHVFMKRQGRNCTPNIYLDGVRQLGADGDVKEVVAGMEIEAMEVYAGSRTPIEFQIIGGESCGAIVIWRRKQ